MTRRFDVIVVGGGHAGCEAALAADRAGAKVAMVTLRLDRIAHMSCNPAIGGVGKGHLVREVDALGGAMGRVADATGLQFRRLNMSRGPAVRSTRCQSDSTQYRTTMREVLDESGIEIIEDEVLTILCENGRLRGLLGANHGKIEGRSLVVTTGTFLNGLCHVGDEQFAGGRVGDKASRSLSGSLLGIGIELGRFKTGTTPRLAAESIDWEILAEQRGDDPPPRFSFDPVDALLPQVSCHVTRTNHQTHEVIQGALDRSPLFTGVIHGTGPRYCPSIEDKVVRFPDKSGHTIFLEPESLVSERIYPNGLSTSLPRDAQEAFLRTIEGLSRARILEPGYAVEYDFAPPTQLNRSLMLRRAPGVFLAGQINGTSGYEEAAAQGLMAGLNAARFAVGEEPVIIGRHQAYIGVMIDDLVTKGVDEPYRMFTSRAEHRLTLRESNAEARLLELGRSWGLIAEARYRRGTSRIEQAEALKAFLERTKVGRELAVALELEAENDSGLKRSEILRRPEISIDMVAGGSFAGEIGTVVEEAIKYEGYIAREKREIERLMELEDRAIPNGTDFTAIPGLSTELSQKLSRVSPTSLAQASRIPGMTPAGLSLLRVALAARN